MKHERLHQKLLANADHFMATGSVLHDEVPQVIQQQTQTASISHQDQQVQADLNVKERALSLKIMEVIKELGLVNTFNTNYITINNFSPHSSDSEGKASYKRLRRELEYQKDIEVRKRQRVEKEYNHHKWQIEEMLKEIMVLKQQLNLHKTKSTKATTEVDYHQSRCRNLELQLKEVTEERDKLLELIAIGQQNDSAILFGDGKSSLIGSREWSEASHLANDMEALKKDTQKPVQGIGQQVQRRQRQLEMKERFPNDIFETCE